MLYIKLKNEAVEETDLPESFAAAAAILDRLLVRDAIADMADVIYMLRRVVIDRAAVFPVRVIC
jgi:hypothetical protein